MTGVSHPLFGVTRTRVAARHALITPDGHVPSLLPGTQGAVRIIAHITPALGAGFSQSTLIFSPQSSFQINTEIRESFFYVTDGELMVESDSCKGNLSKGGFFYLCPHSFATLRAETQTTVLVFEKLYVPLLDTPAPSSFCEHADSFPANPFLGNPNARLQILLPENFSFDLAVNLFTYQPGATLPFVETHVMEHGLIMLSGQGIYRLEDCWYPVCAGDVIWMAPYCPQWFVAMGDTPASYLYYKDVHRPFLNPSQIGASP